MRTCVRMIVCVLLPRFELTVAAGGRAALLEQPAALAPEPGREAFIGEVSLAAEAFGVRPGLRLGEALARCPRLALVPPDPAGVAGAWEGLLTRLESIGAAVAPDAPGAGVLRRAGARAPARRDRGRGRRRAARAAGVRPGSGSARPPSARWPPPAGRACAGPPTSRGRRAPTWRRCRCRCCAAGPRPRRCRPRSSASAWARSARSPRCRARPWPTASGRPACAPTRWRAGRTRGWSRARRSSR